MLHINYTEIAIFEAILANVLQFVCSYLAVGLTREKYFGFACLFDSLFDCVRNFLLTLYLIRFSAEQHACYHFVF